MQSQKANLPVLTLLKFVNVNPQRLIIISAFALLISNLGWAQFEIPPVPKEQTSVYDYVDLLPEHEERALEQKLIRYADSTSTQIVAIIISSTNGEEIKFLAANWGAKWGIGQEDEDNGIVILLAKDDRKVTIQGGYGVEEFATDAMSKRIIETVMIPEFKKGDYYSGLNKGADAIFQVLTGQFKETRNFNDGFPFDALIPFIIFFIILIIIASNKRNGGNRNNRGGNLDSRDIFDIIILSNMGRGGFGGGNSSSGGFGSGGGFGGGFGGGGFGGGGASGGW